MILKRYNNEKLLEVLSGRNNDEKYIKNNEVKIDEELADNDIEVTNKSSCNEIDISENLDESHRDIVIQNLYISVFKSVNIAKYIDCIKRKLKTEIK